MESLSGARKKVFKGQMWHMGLCFGMIWEGLVLTRVRVYVVCVRVSWSWPLSLVPTDWEVCQKEEKDTAAFSHQNHILNVLLSINLDRTVQMGH